MNSEPLSFELNPKFNGSMVKVQWSKFNGFKKNTYYEKDIYNIDGIDGFMFHTVQAYARGRR